MPRKNNPSCIVDGGRSNAVDTLAVDEGSVLNNCAGSIVDSQVCQYSNCSRTTYIEISDGSLTDMNNMMLRKKMGTYGAAKARAKVICREENVPESIDGWTGIQKNSFTGANLGNLTAVDTVPGFCYERMLCKNGTLSQHRARIRAPGARCEGDSPGIVDRYRIANPSECLPADGIPSFCQ